METKLKSALIIVAVVLLISLTVLTNTMIAGQTQKNDFVGLDNQNLPTITVSEQGEVSVAPDTAEISFAVISTAEVVETALNDNNEKMQEVVDYLKQEGVEDKNIQTSSFNVRPLYRYEEKDTTGYNERVVYSYEVSNSVSVTLTDFEKVDTVVDGAVRAGANNVSDLRFFVEDEEQYKKQAREMAINKAKQKAEEISSALGVSLGRIINFSEDYYSPVYPMRDYDMAMEESAGGSSVPIEVGENDISVTARIQYEIK